MESPLSTSCKSSGRNEEIHQNNNKEAEAEKHDNSCQEENHFLRLLNMVLYYVMTLKKVLEGDITRALLDIIESFKYVTGNRFSDVDLSKWEYSCGYLFRYGSHGAGLTRRRTLDAVRHCETLASILKESNLKIISLGGGPGNDVLGLCSALYDCHVGNHLNITVVDSVQEWSLCVKLLKVFTEEGNFGNASKLLQQNSVNLSFLKVLLPGKPKLEKKYFETLTQADVILMTKFLSILRWEDKEVIVKSLYEKMKEEAFILFIDSPFQEGLWDNFEVLYLSKEGEPYISSATTENFGFTDKVTSIARVAVLRKKKKVSR